MTLRRRPGRSSSCHRLKLSPSKKETRTGEIGDRDGYPRRGLSSRSERAGSVQCAEQLILVTIAGIDRALRHARRLGDRINRGAVETKLHEHRAGSFNEMLPPPFWT